METVQNLIAQALQACRIESFQLDSDRVMSGDPITGTIRVNPICQEPINQGQIKIDVTGPSPVLPGVGIGFNANMPGVYRFGVSTAPVPDPTDVVLTARLTVPLPLNSLFVLSSATATVSLLPALLGEVRLPQTVFSAGGGQEGTVTLTRPAPAGGAVIMLESSNPNLVVVQPRVMVPAGMTAATFFVIPISQEQTPVQVRITANYAGAQRTAGFLLQPILVSEISVAPNPVVGGMPAEVTVRLNGVPRQPEVVSVIVSNMLFHPVAENQDTVKVQVPTPVPPAGQGYNLIVKASVRGQEVTSATPLRVMAPPQIAGGRPPGLIRRFGGIQPPPGG